MTSKLARIEGSGVLGEFSYEVNFDDESRLRVIYAENGRGKTTFLRAVSALLMPGYETMQQLVELPIEALSISFVEGGYIAFERSPAMVGGLIATACDNASEPVAVDIDLSDFSARMGQRVWAERSDYVEYTEKVRSLTFGADFVGDDRLGGRLESESDTPRNQSRYSTRVISDAVTATLDQAERLLTRSVYSWIRNVRDESVYAEITRVTLQGSRRITAAKARREIEETVGRLIELGTPFEKYGLLSLNEIREIDAQLQQARVNDSRIPAVHTVLMPYFDSLQVRIQELEPAFNLMDRYVRAANHFLDRKELSFSMGKGICLTNHSDEALNIRSLSSGERHLLMLLSRTLLATESNQLMIIDEPEISLGLSWQRDLLDELLKCSASTGVQFLVASHSLQVLGGVPRKEIIRPCESS